MAQGVILHIDGVEHGLQRPIGLVNLVLESCDVRAIDAQVYDSAHSPSEAPCASVILDLVHQNAQFVERHLTVHERQFALAPEVLLHTG